MGRKKLFCIPYAVASSYIYNDMKKELQNEYDIVPLDCAGKGRRINEPFYKDIDEAVSDLLSIIINEIKDERYSIFGYSLGSLLTYEIACKLKQLSYKMPECVFLSAMKPPDKIKDLEKKHLLSDKEFIKAIVSMGGVNKDYFDDKRYYDFCLPLLRSDYNLIGNYQYKKRNFKLDTKGIILYSSEENINDDIFRWNNYFDKQCKFYEFDNGHFFINYHLDKIVKIIRMNWIEKTIWKVMISMKNRDYELNKVPQYMSIKEMLEKSVQKYKDRVMFEYLVNKQIISKTYDDFLKEVNYVGTWLLNEDYRNSNIIILGNNSYEWLLSFFAITVTGNIVIPIDKSLTTPEALKQIWHSEGKMVIYSDEYSPMINEIKNSSEEGIKYMPMSKLQQIIEIMSGMLKKGKNAASEYKIDDDDLAAIIYTSGTTGDSKGVMLSHKNLISDVVMSLELLAIPQKTMIILPLHHSFPLAASVFISIINGCTIYINESLKHITRDMKCSKPEYIAVVPMLVEAFYNQINANILKQKKLKTFKVMLRFSKILRCIKIDLRHKLFKKVIDGFGGRLNLIICGGAKLDPKYIKWFDDIGIKIACGYGISECSPVLSATHNKHFMPESVGTILPKVEAKLINVDENGIGEICVKGDIVFKGYFKDEEQTKNAFIDGWFRTGDLGYIDNRKIILTGRLKNLIILSNGKNISPEELEEKIYKLPYVKEALVYAENNKIVAEVFFHKSETEDLDKKINTDILKINKELSNYKNISEIKIRKDEFQKTSTMKIKRNYV